MNAIVYRVMGWMRVNRLRLVWSLAGVIAVLTVSITLSVYIIRSPRERKPETKHAAPTLMAAGQANIGRANYWTLSSSGRFICAMDRAGNLSLFEAGGAVIYRVAIKGCDTAVVSPSGRYVMAYPRMDAEAGKVALIGPGGKVERAESVNGAVWSADAASRGAADYFVVGTGNGTLYVLRNSGKGWHKRTHRAGGAVVSVSADEQGTNVVSGCWQTSAITKMSMDGRRKWQVEAESRCLQEVNLLPAGLRIFVKSRPNNPLKCGHYGMLDADGATLWTRPSCFSASERFHPSPRGDYVAVAYSRPIRNKEKVLYERHCVIVDANGEQLIDKGSLFSDIRPILMTDGGYAVLHNSDKSIMALGPTGDMKPLTQVPSKIVAAQQSEDGSTAAVRCEDGFVRSFHIAQ